MKSSTSLSLVALSILIFLMLRAFLPAQIDDVNPLMGCTEEELAKADEFYVVPIYQGYAINESKEWCDSILAMNKTLHLHGVFHTYREFLGEVKEEDLDNAISIFEDCFGFKPERFKPPQVSITAENQKLIESRNLNLDLYPNHALHKIYHCNDTGRFSNRFNDLI